MRGKVFLRADGSQSLGLGHIMRCLALAEGLQNLGATPVFALRGEEPAVAERVQRAGYPVERLPARCSFAEDLELMKGLLSSGGLVVTDLCNSDTLGQLEAYQGYLAGLREAGAYLVTIDDLNTFCFPSDVLINPNWGAERLQYQQSPGTTYLLGPRYFLFRPEFIRAADRERKVRADANRVLVTLGGGDIQGATAKVLRALLRLHRERPREIRVALGLEDGAPTGLGELAQGFGGRCELVAGDEDMADLMQWSDVAIIGGGLTKYEAAVTGTPALVLSQVEHQWAVTQEFCQGGAALHLGRSAEVGEEEIAHATAELLPDESRRRAMSQAGKAMVDGGGVERVLERVGEWHFLT